MLVVSSKFGISMELFHICLWYILFSDKMNNNLANKGDLNVSHIIIIY